MTFRYSSHAESELVLRRIPRDVVDEVLRQPQQIVPERPPKKAYQSQVDVGGGRIMLVRAIVDDTVEPAVVVNRISDQPDQQVLETTMKVIYDPEVDVLRILFRNTPIEESDEDKPGVILDYDKDGNLVGMEILDASERMENPRAMDYAIAESATVVREKTVKKYGS